MGLFNRKKAKPVEHDPPATESATIELRIPRPQPGKNPPQKFTEEDILNDLAEFNEKQGNLVKAFYFRNKKEIDSFEKEVSGFLQAAQSAESDDLALLELNNAKAAYEAYRFWCCSQPGGLQYYDAHDLIGPHKVSQYDIIQQKIAEREFKLSIAPTILEKAKDGVLQADLIKQFNTYPSEIRLIIQKLEEEGKIIREKSGRSYIIKTK